MKLPSFTDLSLCTHVSSYGFEHNVPAINVSRRYAWPCICASSLWKTSYVT